MYYDEMIKKALNEKLTKSQGNYQVVYDADADKSFVFMFGNKIFTLDHAKMDYAYNFCGYEGYPKTTRAINYCLEAVDAEIRVKTRKSHVIEEYITV